MNLTLPNGEEIDVASNLDIESKKQLCEELLKEFDDMIMDHPKNVNVKNFINRLGDYLIFHKEDAGERDKNRGILSESRENQMAKTAYHGRYRSDTLFTDLSITENKMINGDEIE